MNTSQTQTEPENHLADGFHQLRVKTVRRETPDAVSIEFNVPQDLKRQFSFRAGQYITVVRQSEGGELRRSYSLCSAPQESTLKVAVKRIQNGRVSTWLTEEVKPGDELIIGRPEGAFTMDFDPSHRRHHYFFAAGSGITPVMSLIKSGLEAEPLSTFVLLYGNRTEESIIFKDELDELSEQYGDQIQIFHTLSRQKSLAGRLRTMLRNKSESKFTGRIDAKLAVQLIREIPYHKSENHFYLCGPGDMIKSMEKHIQSDPIPGYTIHKEYFSNPDQAREDIEQVDGAMLTYKNMNLADGDIEIPKGKTILEALLDKGADAPYSCMNGVCSSCMAKLVKGKVEMDTCLALEDEEVEAGYILTCQSHPVTKEVEIHYE